MDKDFEQNHFSLTTKGTYKIGHNSIRLKKKMAYHNRYYDNFNFFD